MLHVIQGQYMYDYIIKVSFNDGCVGEADFAEKILSDKRQIVRELQDKKLFRNFHVQGNTIMWKNGLDFAPEFIKSLIQINDKISCHTQDFCKYLRFNRVVDKKKPWR